jgi:hypothetical protein
VYYNANIIEVGSSVNSDDGSGLFHVNYHVLKHHGFLIKFHIILFLILLKVSGRDGMIQKKRLIHETENER